MRGRAIGTWLSAVVMGSSAAADLRLHDDCASAEGWTLTAADGVTAQLRAEGTDGGVLRLDFDFTRGSGFVISRKRTDFLLPENYVVQLRMRADAPVNNLELKLVDAKRGANGTIEPGDNVWWVNRRGFAWPRDWETVRTPMRKFEFAWGPSGGKRLERVGAVEIVIAANTPQATGGKGTVWIDDLRLEALAAARPVPTAAHLEATGVDVRIDLGGLCEVGGLIVDWGAADAKPRTYAVSAATESREHASAEIVARVNGSAGRFDYVRLRDVSAAELRFSGVGEGGLGLPRAVRVLDASVGDTANAFLQVVAEEEIAAETAARTPNIEKDTRSADGQARPTARGRYPRTMQQEQRYWTVVGAPACDEEWLVAEDGTVELDRAGPSIEPMLEVETPTGVQRFTWADGETKVEQTDGAPVPHVERRHGNAVLSARFAAVKKPGAPADAGAALVALYTARRADAPGEKPPGERQPLRARVVLAVRPWQVLPPWQQLNISGGAAEIHRIAWEEHAVRIDGHEVRLSADEWEVAAATFAEGKAWRATRVLKPGETLEDPDGLAYAELRGPWTDLSDVTPAKLSVVVPRGPGGQRAWQAAVAEADENPRAAGQTISDSASERVIFDEAVKWRHLTERVKLELPPSAARLVATFHTQQAHVLVNMDGPWIQPGSRTYERSWIRDGALTGTALLGTGHADDVKAFLEWYAPFQYENGKVPCVVDARGPDATNEHDSHGELIYAIWKYYRFTRDREFLERLWPHVEKAVEFIASLRRERMTPEYRNATDLKRAMYGLVPESISHEGYSAQPRHSYWDTFFLYKGLKDAVRIARELGKETEAAGMAQERDGLAEALRDSLRLTMKTHGIAYIPGCVELGDFDPTSTTIALFPTGAAELAPPAALEATFERWWTFFEDRRTRAIKSNEYTPYELRTVGSWVRLGRRDRALAALEFYFQDQRPADWFQWAEVVWRDPLAPRFIGDMPHTWVGSDYLNAVRSMLVYEQEAEEGTTLVVGAGVPRAWLEEVKVGASAVAITDWPTEAGVLTYRVVRIGARSAQVRWNLRPHPSAGNEPVRLEFRFEGQNPASSSEPEGVATLIW